MKNLLIAGVAKSGKSTICEKICEEEKYNHIPFDYITASIKRNYPEWFIDELVNEEDKERARLKLLSTKERVSFKCDKGEKHYTQIVGDHINLSNGSKKHGCPN